MEFDPWRWCWPDSSSFHSYTAKKGRLLLNPRLALERPIPEKWNNLLLASFFPNWQEVWNRCRPKEARFLWSIYHGAVATNVWQARIAPHIDPSCTCYDMTTPKMLIHCFHHCPKTQHAWNFAKTLLYRFVNLPTDPAGYWPDFTCNNACWALLFYDD